MKYVWFDEVFLSAEISVALYESAFLIQCGAQRTLLAW
jgi:hypothetical protein